MKTNKIILASLLTGFLALGAATFAFNKTNVSSILGSKFMSRSHTGALMGMFNSYIDYAKLTDEQKASLKTLSETHRTKMQESMKAMVGLTGDALVQAQTQMKTQWTAQMKELRAYVSEDKLSAFDEFVAAGPQANKMNKAGLKNGRGKSNMKGGMMLGGMFNSYIDYAKLTDEQKASLKTLSETHRTKMQESMKAMVGLTGDALVQAQTQMKTQWTAQMKELRAYVSEDKLSSFDEFVAAGPQANKMNKTGLKNGRGKSNMKGGMMSGSKGFSK